MLRCSTIYAFSICFSVCRIALSYATRFRMFFSVSVSGNCSYAFNKSRLRCSKWIISSDACLFSRSALIRRLYSDTALRRSFSSCSGLFTLVFRAYTVRVVTVRLRRLRHRIDSAIMPPIVITNSIVSLPLVDLESDRFAFFRLPAARTAAAAFRAVTTAQQPTFRRSLFTVTNRFGKVVRINRLHSLPTGKQDL